MSLSPEKTLHFFCLNLFVLILLGLVMVYSASYLLAKESFGFAGHFFLRQFFFSLCFVGILFWFKRSDFNFWMEYGLKIHLAIMVLILLTFIPKIGLTSKGAHRWLHLGFISLQPGEFVKYTILFPAIRFFDQFYQLKRGERLSLVAALLGPLLLLVLQPDFGTFSLCIFTILFVGLLSSFSRRYFFSLLALAISALMVIVMMAPYRVQRILTFLDPWKDPQGSGFQIIQSYLAFANGHIFGKGIGNSDEKLFYLPEAHNDFIFSIIGEELGFIGLIFVVGLFLAFIYWGLKLATYSKNRTTMIMMISVIFVIGIQAFLNMGVVLGLLPTKGMNLPFISYGGSAMLANAFGIGLFLAAHQTREE